MDSEAVTMHQAAYLVHLREQREAELADRFQRSRTDVVRRGNAALLYALLRSLPEPATASEAAEEIRVLEDRDLMTYSRAHPEWAQPILDRVTAVFGEGGERLPETWDEVMERIDVR